MGFAKPLVVAAVLAATGAAHAAPCEVTFVRAPSEARHVIESWLAAEPRCTSSIQLRVIETESGSLYLIAQRPDGRIHEREVPDAQSAGVLVASWVADDWTSAPDAQPSTPAPAPAPGGTVDPYASVASGAPGLTAALPAVPPPPPTTGPGRWLTFSGMIQTEGEGGSGARFEIDLFGGRTGGWTLGVVGVAAASETVVGTPTGWGYLDTMDLRALGVVARTWSIGTRWRVRWSAGLGPTYTDAKADITDDVGGAMRYLHGTGTSVAAESALAISREVFDRRWAITAGPIATMIDQSFIAGDGTRMERQKVELMFALGARYRL